MKKRPPDEFDLDPAVQVMNETIEAITDLYRPLEAYHHFPWPALDRVVGGMPGGEVCYLAAFSSNGKTMFLTSLVDEIFTTTKKKIYFMGLESKPKTLRTHWACKRLGYDAGDLFSGKFLEWPNGAEIRREVEKDIHKQNLGEEYARVRFCPTPYINAEKILRAADAAAAFGADIFIIDHVDHIEGTGKGLYEQSQQANQAILNIAQEYGFLMLPATQLNQETVKGNRIALHLPPQPHHVKWGNGKREKSTWMLGAYRPLKVSGVSITDLKLVNSGSKPASEVCEKNTMGIVIMKHRFYGQREWQRVYLGVERGKIKDANQDLYCPRP